MTTKYIETLFIQDCTYHVYNRGDRKLAIFFDDIDKYKFLSFLNRYLSNIQYKKSNGLPYDNFHNDVKLVSFALMNNHFHLMLKLISDDSTAIPRLMKCLMNSYDKYIKSRYDDVPGTFLQGVYKAKNTADLKLKYSLSSVNAEEYNRILSYYINCNPLNFLFTPFNSYYYWKNMRSEDCMWLSWEIIHDHNGIKNYHKEIVKYSRLKNKYNLEDN